MGRVAIKVDELQNVISERRHGPLEHLLVELAAQCARGSGTDREVFVRVEFPEDGKVALVFDPRRSNRFLRGIWRFLRKVNC